MLRSTLSLISSANQNISIFNIIKSNLFPDKLSSIQNNKMVNYLSVNYDFLLMLKTKALSFDANVVKSATLNKR